MALTTEEQKFYDFAKASLPDWIPDGDEFLMGAAKMFGSVRELIDYLFGNALISSAVGATATTPDWLNLHAADRGTRRQLNEDDPTLRERLRNVPDALTRLTLLAAIDAILAANGVSGSSAIVELPKDGAHSASPTGWYQEDAGTGGTFAVAGTTVKFTPDVLPWARPPKWPTNTSPARSSRIVLSSSTDPLHDGTHVVTALDGDAAVWTDASPGAAGPDAAVTWLVETLDVDGNVRDGFARAFSQRGYRSARLRPLRLVIILPYGSTAATEASVREALRQKKAAGIAVTIERRLIAP